MRRTGKKASRWRSSAAALGVLAGVLVASGTAFADAVADPGVVEITRILRAQGLIDDAQETQILAKSASADEARKKSDKLAGFTFAGDFRLRWDDLRFRRDDLGVERKDRARERYRLRLGVEKKITERLTVGFRLASGDDDPRSRNHTLGDLPDFAEDPVRFDLAYYSYVLPETSFGLKTTVLGGKTQNPFRMRIAPDCIVFDPDITPEGASLLASLGSAERSRVYANAGAYVIQELPDNSNSMLYGLQGGASHRFSALPVEVGGRVSGYAFRALGADFQQRAATFGNLPSAFDERHASIGEAFAYLRLSSWRDWPLLAWATAIKNFSADSAVLSGVAVGAEANAYGFGFELGDRARSVEIGVGFFQLQANAVMAPFTDTDHFDGLTNVKVWSIWASRQLRPNLMLRAWFSQSDALRDTGGPTGPFSASLPDRDRGRWLIDLDSTF